MHNELLQVPQVAKDLVEHDIEVVIEHLVSYDSDQAEEEIDDENSVNDSIFYNVHIVLVA